MCSSDLEVLAHFDNSQDNAANPFRPVQPLRWGESTDEEMCIAFVEMVPTRPAPLRAPSRAERIQFFLQSQWLDDSRPPREKLRLIQRLTARLKQLEESGGLLPELSAGPGKADGAQRDSTKAGK